MWATLVESNPVVGNGDTSIMVGVPAKEESHLCCHCEDLLSYDDSHPDSERYKKVSGCQSGG